MNPRMIITVTLLACLLMSGPVWAQGQQPVCPCWTAEELEAAVSASCFGGSSTFCQRAGQS
jgi:hypothetical protein